jgi:isocitrate dehydrogenase (NAD+)
LLSILQGARHAGLDIAGQDKVNPTAILLSSVMMLRYLKLPNFADRMEHALFATLAAGTRTHDAGGTASTTEFVDAICSRVRADSHKARAGKTSKGVSRAV